MRTSEENLILLPNMKQLFLFALLTSYRMFAYLSHGIFCFSLQKSLILDFLLGIVTENVFFAWLFLESIKC